MCIATTHNKHTDMNVHVGAAVELQQLPTKQHVYNYRLPCHAAYTTNLCLSRCYILLVAVTHMSMWLMQLRRLW